MIDISNVNVTEANGYPKHGKVVRAHRERHGGLFNVAFCDGHIEGIKKAKLFTTDEPILRRWNNDNQPHRDQLP